MRGFARRFNIAVSRAKTSPCARSAGIEKFISENPEECSALISVGSNDGKIGSMSLNAASVNLFKSRLVRAVDEALRRENTKFTVKIPLGAITEL